jgi:outer membrane protein TolC
LEQIRLNSTKTLKNQAIGEFLPNVSANVQYGQRNSHYIGQTYDSSTKQTLEEVKLDQPIFDGFHSVSKFSEANYKIKSGGAKTSDKIQEISFAAASSYCNLFRYQELVKLQKENKELGKKFLDLVSVRKDSRIIDKSDIIKFNYEISVIEEKYLDVLNKLNKAKFDYENVIGELHENVVKPSINEENFNKEKVVDAVMAGNNNINTLNQLKKVLMKLHLFKVISMSQVNKHVAEIKKNYF